MKELTQKELKEQLKYDPEMGIFTRLVSNSPMVNVGDVFGFKNAGGYTEGYVLGVRYKMHHLVWLYMTGEWAEDLVDHINRKRGDNRWCNLRECNASQNRSNSTINKNNTSGYKGVHKFRNRWKALIHHYGISVYIGCYGTREEAALAYNEKATELKGQFACLNEL